MQGYVASYWVHTCISYSYEISLDEHDVQLIQKCKAN